MIKQTVATRLSKNESKRCPEYKISKRCPERYHLILIPPMYDVFGYTRNIYTDNGNCIKKTTMIRFHHNLNVMEG